MLMTMQIITIRGAFLETSIHQLVRWRARKCKTFEDIDNMALVWKSLMSLNSVYSYFIGKESIIDILWLFLIKQLFHSRLMDMELFYGQRGTLLDPLNLFSFVEVGQNIY